MTEVIRRALTLYDDVVTHSANGGTIYFGDADGEDLERVRIL